MLSFRLASLSGLLLLVEVIPPQTFPRSTMSCTIRTRKYISKGPTLVSLHNLVVYLFISPGLEIRRGLPPLSGISGRVTSMVTGSIAGCLQSKNLMFEAKEATR
jgi:formate-dependent nitrite reductase membrane component NrfD